MPPEGPLPSGAMRTVCQVEQQGPARLAEREIAQFIEKLPDTFVEDLRRFDQLLLQPSLLLGVG